MRRALCLASASAGGRAAHSRLVLPTMSHDSDGSLISRSEGILNFEMPFARLRDFVTPTDEFYVRCHFPVPTIDLAQWRLRIEGEVDSPCELTYEELRALPQETITATIECAGNSRSFLKPKVKGVPWGLGAVGNATWSGVRLHNLLERVGVKSDAREVILQGADKGEIKEAPKPPGEIHYARSLPVAKARGDVLLALDLNGAPLSPGHGFPLRAVVPGWFGMAAVKWLERIVVTNEPFHGYYQSIDYSYWEERSGMPTLVSLGEMRVKAQIARPEMNEVIPAASDYRMHGAAWSGEAEVTMVEVSVDGGRNWSAATLLGEPVQNAWRLWEYTWRTPRETGTYQLMARATDSKGQTQPPSRMAQYGTYMINHYLPIEVQVRNGDTPVAKSGTE